MTDDDYASATDGAPDGKLTSQSRRRLLKAGVGTAVGAAVLSGSSLVSADVPDDPEDFHVYLLFGQSNMEGAAEPEPQDRETDEQVMVLQDQTCPNLGREYGEWYVAEPPLNRCQGGLGPGDYFGKTMADEMPPEKSIGLVPAAVSGADYAHFTAETYRELGRRYAETMLPLVDVDGSDGEELPPVGDTGTSPQDLDDDGLYEDIDADGDTTHDDVTTFFEHLEGDTVQNNPEHFDFDENGRIGFGDVIELLRGI